MFRRIAILSIAVACLAGCSMAPNYNRPETPISTAWPTGPAYKDVPKKSADKTVTDIPWQEFFVNPQLQKLIGLALANNRDLRVAALNIEKSRAQFRIQRADLFPKVDAGASATYQRLAEDFSGTGLSVDLHQYTVGLGVSSYELDLFGRVQNLKDQALQQFFATGEARRSVQISLVAEVAALLRASTKVDAKAVQDFLFRRSIDGNPDILRAGSENLDAARRAALIAKLEAQAGIPAPVEATEG